MTHWLCQISGLTAYELYDVLPYAPAFAAALLVFWLTAYGAISLTRLPGPRLGASILLGSYAFIPGFYLPVLAWFDGGPKHIDFLPACLGSLAMLVATYMLVQREYRCKFQHATAIAAAMMAGQIVAAIVFCVVGGSLNS
jgi:hypothetical protein